ncbi:hypothetical protein CK203_060923 [Vitis vinifera]|uniref:Uncharacterized protein n=1 Tax=Vitis vinifera TaxID=29760 RepID=A0A438GGN4_VITVI|nr:hypothetical protein CK203_060923 [Vitis vinifera]
MEGGLLTPLVTKLVPQPVLPRLKLDLHCSHHQGPRHDTDHCKALRHAIQDLIDQVAMLFKGATSCEEVRREDDEVLRQLIRVQTTTTLEGLIHMMMTGRATCIVFSNDDLPPAVKFIHDGQVITVETLEIEDFCRDFIVMSFDQHNNTMILDMMREIRPHLEDIDSVVITDGDIELQHLFHQLQLGDGTLGTSISVVIVPLSLDQASLLYLCFLEEDTDDGVVIDPAEMIDGVVACDEYRDEMDMMSISKITSTV